MEGIDNPCIWTPSESYGGANNIYMVTYSVDPLYYAKVEIEGHLLKL